MPVKSVLFLICFLSFYSVFSQEGNDKGVVNLTKISFLSPGFSYEHKIGRFQTLYGRVFLSPSGYYLYSSSLGSSSQLYLDPAISLQYRYYYNAGRREAKGRRVDMNNLNYLAPVYKMIFNVENTGQTLHKAGFVWGLQRNYRKRFSLDLNLGIGYAFAKQSNISPGDIDSDQVSEITTIGQINLGFWLNRRS